VAAVGAAVDVDHLGRDVARLGGGQEGDRVGDVGRAARPAVGGLADEQGAAFGRDAVAEELGVLDQAGRDDVRRDATAAELEGEVADPGVERGLGRPVNEDESGPMPGPPSSFPQLGSAYTASLMDGWK
jgi:hypothetical protein